MTAFHRIGYIGNFTKPWCTEVHVAGALRSHGHTVIEYQEGPYGDARATDWPSLAARAEWDGCDFVLWTRTWHVDPPVQMAQLADLERRGIPTVGYHLDRWWGLEREALIHEEPWFRQTVLCTADGGHDDDWRRVGIEHRWFPPAVSAVEAAPGGTPRDDFRSDIAFVGSWQNYHPSWPYRLQLVQMLRESYDRFGTIKFWPQGEAIRQQRLNDLYASVKVVVGDSCLVEPTHHYWSDRVSETLGRGGFLIHPNTPGLDEQFTPGEHLATYDLGNWQQLRMTIASYLADDEERARVVLAGRAHVLEHHTYERRMVQLVEMLRKDGFVSDPDTKVGISHSIRIDSGHGDTRAVFDLRAGSTDAAVVNETWRENVYRLGADDVVGKVVVDLGANVGAFTIWAAKAGAAFVYAYEPSPLEAARLMSHLDLNGLTESVSVVEAAVLDRNGTRFLTEATGMTRTRDVRGSANDVAIPVVALDDVIRTAGYVDVLKVDVEGDEYLMFDRFHHWDQIGSIVMEFHGAENLAGKLPPDGAWARLVEAMAEHGHLTILGRPSAGGQLYWRRY